MTTQTENYTLFTGSEIHPGVGTLTGADLQAAADAIRKRTANGLEGADMLIASNTGTLARPADDGVRLGVSFDLIVRQHDGEVRVMSAGLSTAEALNVAQRLIQAAYLVETYRGVVRWALAPHTLGEGNPDDPDDFARWVEANMGDGIAAPMGLGMSPDQAIGVLYRCAMHADGVATRANFADSPGGTDAQEEDQRHQEGGSAAPGGPAAAAGPERAHPRSAGPYV